MSKNGVRIMAENGATVLVMKIITIVVAVLMIATVALPVIEDAQAGLVIHKQNTGQTYSMIESSSTTEYVITVSGTTVTVNDYTVGPLSELTHIAFTDTLFVQYLSSSLRVLSDNYTGNDINTTTITFSNGTATWTSNGNSYSNTYSWIMIADPDGNYGAFNSGEVFFNADSKVFLGYTNLTTNTNSDLTPTTVTVRAAGFFGTYDDLQTLICTTSTAGITSISGTAVIDSAVVHSDSTISVNLASSQVSCVFTTDVGDYTDNIELYGRIIAPLEYTVIDNSMYSLFGVIGVLLVIVPVMMAVRMMALKRN